MDASQLKGIAGSREMLEHASEGRVKYANDICRILTDLLIYVDTGDISLTPHLIFKGLWEPWVTRAIINHVHSGMTCVDVGANVGYYALIMGILSGGKTVAVEPNPRLCSFIRKTSAVNGVEIEVMRVAAGAVAGEMELVLPDGGHNGSATLFRKVIPASVGVLRTFPVPVRSLDDVCKGFAVDFIKIDAEGSEPMIWTGMAGLWKNNPKLTVCMEFQPRFYADSAKFVSTLQEDGARIQHVDHRGEIGTPNLPKAIEHDTQLMLWITRK